MLIKLSPILRGHLTLLKVPRLVNSPESLKVQNPEESNADVDGINPLKNVDLDLTLSSCADDEWDNTVQIPVSATPRNLRKLKHRYHEHHDVYALQSILNLTDINASSKRKYFMNIENKALGNKSPNLSILWLSKSRVKSNSLGTTKFLVVNGSIDDDADTIDEQFSQHFLQWYNTEIETSINIYPILTFRHLPKIDFIPPTSSRP
ncbi:unnamed protein product [Schistosoma mattheei]|uniref:Uncharacterized protein n=1 Tax=Schistosoma mattheei TaxID=31246 RepID=A0A183P371_9TREM|nr:unnamed protein product [Schistosoma mattheei]